jgi:hypothetical protein
LAGLTAISVSESVLADPEGTWVLENKKMSCKLVNIQRNNSISDADSGRKKMTEKK